MASLAEILMRAEQLAVGRGADVHNNPVTDAGITAEVLFPHALKYCLERSVDTDLEDTIVEHDILVTDRVGTLPQEVLSNGLKSGFLPDFPYSSIGRSGDFDRQKFSNLLCYWTIRENSFMTDCEGDQWKLLRTMTGAQSNGTSLSFTPASPDLYIVDGDADRRIVVFASDGTQLADEQISAGSISPPDLYILQTDLAIQHDLTVVIYTPYVYRFQRLSVGPVTVSIASGVLSVVAGNGDFSDDDIGRRVVVIQTSTGIPIVDSIVTAITDPLKGLEFLPVSTVLFAVQAMTINFYDVGDHLITLACPSVPAMPATPTENIPIPRQVTEDVILVIAACLTGEMKLKEVMG
jgi:WD40 repeat protein